MTPVQNGQEPPRKGAPVFPLSYGGQPVELPPGFSAAAARRDLLHVLDIRERAQRIVRATDREAFLLIAALDLVEGDCDLEPSLGSVFCAPADGYGQPIVTRGLASQNRWASGRNDERELDLDVTEGDADEDREEDDAKEPSLGSIDRPPAGSEPNLNAFADRSLPCIRTESLGDQTCWGSSRSDETEDEHDGAEPPEGEDEPWLAAPEGDQWMEGDAQGKECDLASTPAEDGSGKTSGSAWSSQAEDDDQSCDFEKNDEGSADDNRPLHPRELPRRYVMVADGDCCEPVYRHGQALEFDRDRPAKPGDFVALWFKDEFVKPGGYRVLLKRLVAGPPDGAVLGAGSDELKPAVVVEMLNPPKQMVVLFEALEAIHVCLGPTKNERLPVTPAQARQWAAAERRTASGT